MITKKATVFAVTLFLCACASVSPKTHRELIAATYLSIESTADMIAIAKKNDAIDAAERDRVTSDLREALSLTNSALEALMIFEESGDEGSFDGYQSRIASARSILSIIESIVANDQ